MLAPARHRHLWTDPACRPAWAVKLATTAVLTPAVLKLTPELLQKVTTKPMKMEPKAAENHAAAKARAIGETAPDHETATVEKQVMHPCW